MTFDVIELSEEDILAMSTVQMRLLRTAQRAKDELDVKLARDKQAYRTVAVTAGMLNSSLYDDKCEELEEEYGRELAILQDDLIYNLSVNVPVGGDDSPGTGGDEEAGYIVDYTLSYLDRYQIVRGYYLAIADPAERLAAYSADTTAQHYLGQYYNTLYNVFAQYV